MENGSNDIDWVKHKEVNNANDGYSYSALTETKNSKILLLYEKYDSWSRNQLHLKNTMKYRIYDFEDLVLN